MTAELVRGQNHPLPHTRLEIRVTAGVPVLACATFGDERGDAPGTDSVAHPGSPALPGVEVSRRAATGPRLHIDLEAVPAPVQLVRVVLALPEGVGGPDRFGAAAAPSAVVASADGAEIAGFTLTGLDAESAVIALELYRRHGGWKVRAVGQGYAGGLGELLADQGVPGARETAAGIQEAAGRHPARAVREAGPGPGTPDGARRPGAVNYTHPGRPRLTATPATSPATSSPAEASAPPSGPGEPPRPVAGDAGGWTMDERLYNQVWGMFEDLARSVAAYRGATGFAESRMDQELDRLLADPRGRTGGAGEAARARARAAHDELAGRARTVLDRDLDRLAAESEVVEPALPPAYARWDSACWQDYQVPREAPMALRLGDLRLPERPGLRIPMLVRLPLERGLWIDSGRSGPAVAPAADPRRSAMDTAVSHAARLLAVHPPGAFTVQVIDPAGSATAALAPLTAAGVLDGPPATGAGGVAALLARLTRRVDLVQMAVRGGAAESLPPDLDPAEQLLIVHDFPHGFDDRTVTQLRYLADEGPAVGVHLMMVADREDASGYGPVLDPLWRSLLRITPVPDDHLADPWVGHAWTYEPPVVPPGSGILDRVLRQVAQKRRAPRR
ncbi:TerD family protein [Streptomyces sp. NPDC091212]|uniref:TerD family protein n=1 Tax=Streptomyces sp. NPDC091212 TaxID=3155191 RepID=UPI003413E95B